MTVIPADKVVTWLPPNTLYVSSNGVWLVPEARMQQILRKLNAP